MKLTYLVAALAISLGGCATKPPTPLSTPSGRPEISILAVSKKQVMDKLMLDALSNGMAIKSANDFGIVMTKPAQSFSASLLYGSRYDSTPELRIHLNLLDQGRDVKVFGRGEIVTNPGSAFERITDLTESEGLSIQTMLWKLKLSLE